MILLDKKKTHFVGIGGIGMSAIARVLLDMGCDVSGSDVEPSDITRRLEADGGTIFRGHRRSNLPKGTEVLVYSTAISRDNPEVAEARRRKVAVVHRAEALAELFNRKKGIAVTGTHGKTTTTSLIALMLENCRLDPTVMIGGEVAEFKGNAKLGRGAYLVAEADESDKSFLHLKPFFAVITNIEAEHLDHYKGLDEIKASHRLFIDNLKKGGAVFYNHDDRNTRDIIDGFGKKAKSFGFSASADIYPIDIRLDGFKASFKCVYKKRILGKVDLNIPGRHNVLNALAAILAGLELGLGFEEIADSIKDFGGAKRRFQLRADTGGVMLIDDYAHHPTEIRAVLDACRNLKRKRLVVIFQPHRYTRTLLLADDFGKCFMGADKLILTDIYAASESPIKGVSIKNIYDRVRANGLRDVVVIKKDDIPEYVMRLKRPGDAIVVMGAGDIKEVADGLHERFLISALKGLVKGNVRASEPLALHTSFKIGGRAGIWAQPRDEKDLKGVLIFAKARGIPVFVIGNGTNLLVSDHGFNGIVINLGRSPHFKRVRIKGESVRAGAGFNLARLVRMACEKGLEGLESLVGIPGTAGGAVYMNAGGWANPVYRNIGELVASLRVMDYDGRIETLARNDLEFGYRRSNLGQYIILEATLRLKKGERETLISSSRRFLNIKREKQALDVPSAGCVFKNPPGFQFTCGQMIDMLGLKGKRIGGAQISEKHANFIVNKKAATAKDVMALIELIKTKVKSNYDIDLEMEIKVL